MIADIIDLEVLDDGTIWLLNSLEPFFVGLAPDGEVLEAFGETGDGPDEFGTPRGLIENGLDGEAVGLGFPDGTRS